MSSNCAVTKFGKVRGFFVWRIDNMDRMKLTDMERYTFGVMIHYKFESPELTKIDQYSGIEYKTIIKLYFGSGPPFTAFMISWDVKFRENVLFECSYQINGCEKKSGTFVRGLDGIKTLTIFLDLPVKRNELISPPKTLPFLSFPNRLKKIWENDSSNLKFTIECGGTFIETYKPILASASDVFATMIESSYIEARENRVKIDDFGPKTVQKMLEFCETDDIKEINGYECELFGIAHKYLMNDLMTFICDKMVKNVSSCNFDSYLQLAQMYGLNDFKEWLLKTKSCNNVNGAALTEFVTIEKLFSWAIDNAIHVKKECLNEVNVFNGTKIDYRFDFQSPQMTATDPYSKFKYIRNIKV